MTSNRHVLLAGAALLLLAACSGPGDRRAGSVELPRDGGTSSGLSSSRRLTSLSASEIRSLCTYISATLGPGVMCDGGATIRGTTADECVADFGTPPATCEATVGDAETCAEAVAEACTLTSIPPACSALTCTGG